MRDRLYLKVQVPGEGRRLMTDCLGSIDVSDDGEAVAHGGVNVLAEQIGRENVCRA
jgi:hypothetical protein